MIHRTVLIAFVITLSLLCPYRGYTQSAPVTLTGETKQVPLSSLVKNFRPAFTSYEVDTLESTAPHRSFADRAVETVRTLETVCHVGSIGGYEIIQTCPSAQEIEGRLSAWQSFVSGSASTPPETLTPPETKLYAMSEGRYLIPVGVGDLRGNITDSLEGIETITLSSKCEFPSPAEGDKVSERCSDSLPVLLPPVAAKIEGFNLVLTPLESGPARAFVVLKERGAEVARIDVRVAEKGTASVVSGVPQPRTAKKASAPVARKAQKASAAAPVCWLWGAKHGVGESIVAYSQASAPTVAQCESGKDTFQCRAVKAGPPRWHRRQEVVEVVKVQGRSQRRVRVKWNPVIAPNARAPQCIARAPQAIVCPTGQSLVNYNFKDDDGDKYWVPVPAPAGRTSAQVCLPTGVTLPYTPQSGTGYALTAEIARQEPPQCDTDKLGSKLVRPGFVDSYDNKRFAPFGRDVCVNYSLWRLNLEPAWVRPLIVGFNGDKRYANGVPTGNQEPVAEDAQPPVSSSSAGNSSSEGEQSSKSTISSSSSDESSSSSSSDESSSSSSSKTSDGPDPCDGVWPSCWDEYRFDAELLLASIDGLLYRFFDVEWEHRAACENFYSARGDYQWAQVQYDITKSDYYNNLADEAAQRMIDTRNAKQKIWSLLQEMERDLNDLNQQLERVSERSSACIACRPADAGDPVPSIPRPPTRPMISTCELPA